MEPCVQCSPWRRLITLFEKDAMKYGFLYKSHPASCLQDSEVSFVHKSIQEWLAAFFVAHDNVEIQQLQYSAKGDFLQDASWHGFLLSFLDNKSDLVISMILKTFVPYLKQAVTTLPPGKHEKAYSFEGWLRANGKYFINFLTKCNDAIAIPDDMLKKYPYPSCLAILLAMQKCYPKKVFLYGTTGAEEFHCLVKTLGNVQLQAECLSVSANMDHENDRHALGELLLKMPKCTNLHLRECSLTATALKALLPAIKRQQDKIQTLKIAQNNVHGGGLYIGQLAICSSPSNENLCGLESLDVSACQLTLSDLQAMVDIKIEQKYFHIKKLDLSDNTFTGGGENLGRLMICPITTSGHCCGFEKLDIANCGLTLSDLHSIVDKTKNKNVHMKKLDLSGNEFAGGGEYVGKLIMLRTCSTRNQHSGLDKLYVSDCNLATNDLQNLADAFHGTITNSPHTQVHTKKLYMSGNNFSGGGGYVASLITGNDFHLEVLDISQCSLTTSDLMSIEEKIRSKTENSKHVKQLIMSGNQFNGGGALVAVLISDKQRNGPEDLDVGNCGLTTTDLQAMVKAISYTYWTYWYADTTYVEKIRIPRSFYRNLLHLKTFFHCHDYDMLSHTISLSEFMMIWPDTEGETKNTYVHVDKYFGHVEILYEEQTIPELARILSRIPYEDFEKVTVTLYLLEELIEVHIPRTHSYIVRISMVTPRDTVTRQLTKKDLMDVVKKVRGITTAIQHNPNQCTITETVDHIVNVSLQMSLASGESIEEETSLSPPDVWQSHECFKSIRHLELYLNNLTGGGQAIGELMLKLFSGSQQYLDQKEINLSSCGLTTNDLQDIVTVIKGKQVNLQKLDLQNNAFEENHIFDQLVSLLPGCDIIC